MSVTRAILLGILQGLSEFLPISSSGHLVLVPWLLGWEDPGLTYDTVAHLGTMVAVLVYFRADIVTLLRAWFADVAARLRRQSPPTVPEARLAWLILWSAVPAGLVGMLLEDWVEGLFGAPPVAAALLLVTGALIVVSERLGKRQRDLAQMNARDALAIGLGQAAAIAPGISRSGATIATGLLRGLKREDATRFSFLMALPIIVGAAALQLLGAVGDLSGQQALALVTGFLAAAISGYAAIHYLLRFVRSHSLRPFALYCWAMGALCLIVAAIRWLG